MSFAPRLIDGKVPIRRNSDDEAIVTNCCACEDLAVLYIWEGTGMRDLDTSTSFLGEVVGYACGEGGVYVEWVTGDDVSLNGRERVNIAVRKAHSDGAWSGSTTINLAAGWHTPAGGSGPATVRVLFQGQIYEKTISPGTQSDCASAAAGTVVVTYEDGVFVATLL